MPFHAESWLASAKVQRMTSAERGAFINLLARAWCEEDCTLPDDDGELAVLAMVSDEEWLCSVGATMRKVFLKHPETGRLYNRKQHEVLRQQSQRLESARERKRAFDRRAKGNPEPEKNGQLESAEVGPVPPGEQAVLDKANTVLRVLAEIADFPYRSVSEHLDLIAGRLREPSVTVDGCCQMIKRQAQLWKPRPEMRDKLRPKTLFGDNFASYYDQRNAPVTTPTASGHAPRPKYNQPNI